MKRNEMNLKQRAISDTLDEYLVRMNGIFSSSQMPDEFEVWLNKRGYYIFPPAVQAVLTAAKTWEIAYTSEDGVAIEKIFAARNNLIAAVRAYKEEAKDERETD